VAHPGRWELAARGGVWGDGRATARRRPACSLSRRGGAGMEVYTIGFAKRTAPDFFGALRRAGIRRLVDVRLNNTSQLAGFTKRDDLPFLLHEICRAEYLHEPLLAPTQDMLDTYKKRKGG